MVLLKMDAMISAIMPLSHWQEAFAMLRRKEALKILLDPSIQRHMGARYVYHPDGTLGTTSPVSR